MNAAMVSRVMSIVPERVARMPSGAPFLLEASSCRHAERLTHMAKLLSWMTPLVFLSREDQQLLGLRAANGAPVQAADEDGESDADAEAETEIETEAEADLEPWEPEVSLMAASGAAG